jgi:hypothetical protein
LKLLFFISLCLLTFSSLYIILLEAFNKKKQNIREQQI